MWWQLLLIFVLAPVLEAVLTFIVGAVSDSVRWHPLLERERKAAGEGSADCFTMEPNADSRALLILGIVVFSVVAAFDVVAAVGLAVSEENVAGAVIFGAVMLAFAEPFILAFSYFLRKKILFSPEEIVFRTSPRGGRAVPVAQIRSAEEETRGGAKRLRIALAGGKTIKIGAHYCNYDRAREFLIARNLFRFKEDCMILVVASGNRNKLREIAEIFKGYEIVSMQAAGFSGDIEETGETFEENALIKARAVCGALGKPALADDSGLCVDALGGAPGVHSARFCGRHGDDAANNALLLEKLKGVPAEKRTAYFESSVALCFPDGREVTASGRTYGSILEKAEGEGGFGYDPLFYSDDLGESFGTAAPAEKNAVSHRARALEALSRKLAQEER